MLARSASNFSTQEAETGDLLHVHRQPGLLSQHSKTLSQPLSLKIQCELLESFLVMKIKREQNQAMLCQLRMLGSSMHLVKKFE